MANPGLNVLQPICIVITLRNGYDCKGLQSCQSVVERWRQDLHEGQCCEDAGWHIQSLDQELMIQLEKVFYYSVVEFCLIFEHSNFGGFWVVPGWCAVGACACGCIFKIVAAPLTSTLESTALDGTTQCYHISGSGLSNPFSYIWI